ncbi:MAG: YcjX family protein, partial [Cyanobacteria bacterium MAG APA_bin_95]|nr:YcjX family protein [Cyanobacteria bacterium MAG APA_bin_95]
AALRVTQEHICIKDNKKYYGVCGYLSDKDGSRKRWYEYSGELPDIGKLLEEARKGEQKWRSGSMSFPEFLPKPRSRGQPLPHIRLDKALEFLIGDLL